MRTSVMKIRVYYEDTDCGNVVYYANYLRYMERGRTEFMRESEVSFAHLQRQGLMLVVASSAVTYHAPARYDDLLDVATAIKEFSPVSVTFGTVITSGDGRLLTTGDVKIVCVNTDGKIRRLPEEVVRRLEAAAY